MQDIQAHGNRNFNGGELKNFRHHIYATLAAANADAANASAKLIYVAETNSFYGGRPGSWVLLNPTSSGTGIGTGSPVQQVATPDDLKVKYADFALAITSYNQSGNTLHVVVDPQLAEVAAGDEITVAGSLDGGGQPWLDGTYRVVAMDSGSGVVTVTAGTLPLGQEPISAYGTGTFSDETFPAPAALAVVQVDPISGGPSLWLYDNGQNAWQRVSELDPRLVTTAATQELAQPLSIDPAYQDMPLLGNVLLYAQALFNFMAHVITGPRDLVSVDSTGANTVLRIATDDVDSVPANATLTVIGEDAAINGTHDVISATVGAGYVDLEIVNTGYTNATPTGALTLRSPTFGVTTADEFDTLSGIVTSLLNSFSSHIQSGAEPHDAYLNQTQIEALIGTGSVTAAMAQSIAQTTVTTHDNSMAAHGGILQDINDLISQGGKDSLLFVAQPVEPGVAYGAPIWRRPESGVWTARTQESEPVQGMAMGASTLRQFYDGISVTFDTTGVTLPSSIMSRFTVGMILQFGDAVSNTGYFRVSALDPVNDKLILAPAPIAEGPVSTEISELPRTNNIVFQGPLLVPSGRALTDAMTLDEQTPFFNRLVVSSDIDLSYLTGDLEAVVAGTTDNDGVYAVSTIVPESNAIFLEPVAQVELNAGVVDAITVATGEITFAAGEDLTSVAAGQTLVLASTTDNNGTFSVQSVSGQIVTVSEPLPGTDQAAPAGTGTITSESGLALPGSEITTAEGTVTIRVRQLTHGFESGLTDAAPGAEIYGDVDDPAGYSTKPGRHSLGLQQSDDLFMVDLDRVPKGAALQAEKTAAYTLTGGDGGTVLVFNSASALDLTLPEDATEAVPIGIQVDVINLGAGTVSFVTEGTDTLAGAASAAQNDRRRIVKMASGAWFAS